MLQHFFNLCWSTDIKGVQNTVVTNCVINQYNEYVPEELTGLNITVDGNLTLNENLADNAGLQAAYISYQNSYDNYKRAHKMPGLEMYSNDQLFYIGFAQVIHSCTFLCGRLS